MYRIRAAQYRTCCKQVLLHFTLNLYPQLVVGGHTERHIILLVEERFVIPTVAARRKIHITAKNRFDNTVRPRHQSIAEIAAGSKHEVFRHKRDISMIDGIYRLHSIAFEVGFHYRIAQHIDSAQRFKRTA